MKNKSIDKEIDNVLTFMSQHQPDSDEYTKAVHNLKELCEARGKNSSQIMNILGIFVPAGVAILQVGMILYNEQLHVVTSKALAFVVKGRI